MAMTAAEVGQPGQPVLKTPHTEYNFGATVANEKFLLLGQMGAEGVLTSRMTWKPSDVFGLKMEARTTGERDGSQFMGDLEGAGKDWNGQLKVGSGGFYGLNYMQSITPALSAGGEFFYLQPQSRSGVGLAVRYANDKCVSTMQLATTGIVSLTYYHKVSQKAHVAADFLWNLRAQEATSSLGYDYHLRQCRIRGSIDSNGKVAAYLEERMGPGVQLILSAEVNHWRNDHKFGFGMTVGES